MKKVCIQGYEGSFHQEAARTFLGDDIEVIPCDTFRQLVAMASNKKESDGGVMAIENSIAGSILPNYTLLMKSKLTIVGEVYLHIRQQLMANPGVKLEDIREVHSHPMALLQCTEFLEQHPHWKLVETEDTALSARHLHQHHSKYAAAIASNLAADLYQLKIIAPNIQTMKNNYTRFLVLESSRKNAVLEMADKASVNFVTKHSHGSLVKVLSAIADGGINLSKLQSMPIPGTEFRYSFHADMEFTSIGQFESVCETVRSMSDGFKVLGVYRRGIIKQSV